MFPLPESESENDRKTICHPRGEKAADRDERAGCEVSISEAAPKEKISEQSMGHRWKAQFLETSKQRLIAGKSGPVDPRAGARGRGRGSDRTSADDGHTDRKRL